MGKAISSTQAEKTSCIPCNIEDVFTVDLRIVSTGNGDVLHMVRADSSFFTTFGEVYFSELHAKTVKAWKMHTVQTQHLAVPVGEILVVLYDARKESSSYGQILELVLGRQNNYKLLCIPPYVWYGFSNRGDQTALICNCTDIPHAPQEAQQKDKEDAAIPYTWANS